MMLDLGKMTINLNAVARVEWDFAGHEGTAMVTSIGGDFYWVQDRMWADELREALRLMGNVDHASVSPERTEDSNE